MTVTNPSDDATLAYDLSDTPAFPAGVTVNGVTGSLRGAAVGSWDGTTLNGMAKGTSLAANAKDVYTVVVNATIPDQISSDEATCSSETGSGHGFFNTTEADSGDNHVTAQDCGNIPSSPSVNVVKTVSRATQNADGTWTVVYDLVATNPSVDQSSKYDLDDAVDFGAGITIKSAKVTGPADAVVDRSWLGVAPHTRIVQDRIIAPQTQETYRVTVVAAVAATASVTDRDCTPGAGESGTGFLNTATLASGGDTSTSQACAAPVNPTITKKVASVTSVSNGVSQVAYDVVVSNPSTTTGLVYALADNLGFPDGVTVSDQHVSWVHSALDGTGATAAEVIDGWTGSGDAAVLATGRSLAAGSMDTYHVVVTATVPISVPADLLICSAADGAGHGAFNEGAVTSGDDTLTATACADLPPTIEVLPTSSQSPTPTPSISVKPTTSTMAYTGVNTLGMGWLAILLLGGGILILAMGTMRRRKPRRH